MDYGQDTAYAAMIRAGKSHIPPHVQERLTLERWHRDFQNKIELDEQPFLKDWYLKRFESLTSNVDAEEWLSNFVAVCGILDNRFHGLELEIPKGWISHYPFAKSEYSLDNVTKPAMDYLEIIHLNERFSNEESLRRELALEFVQLYLSELKRIIESANAKSSVPNILERNQRLRSLVNETMFYDSSALYRTFQKLLPGFIEGIKAKDPAVIFFLKILHRRFVDYKTEPDYKLFTNLFSEYFSAIKLGDKKYFEILEAEVMAYLKMLLNENRRLNRKLEDYEAE